MLDNSTIISVKDLNQMVKDLLTDAIGQVWLMGEISNFSKPSSGHWYFTLKDDLAQVRCAMFRNSNIRAGLIPQNGQQVLVRATVTLYEARGEYQLIIDKLQAAGAGLLQQKFEQLKKQLQIEGLFEPQHKKPIPTNINTIGVVTSSTGAALHDICQILKRRDPSLRIIIYPTLVQGVEAAQHIAKMIQLANERNECDVLIVGRGGGSLEDLWSFNEEIVARAIFASQLPIISAVGHEIDFTIADFVADLRAATPSAAAELVSRDQQEQLKHLRHLAQQLAMAMDYVIIKKRESIQKYRHQLQTQHPQVKLAKQQTALLAQTRSLHSAIEQIFYRKSNKINQLISSLNCLSPTNSIIKNKNLIKNNEQKLIHFIQSRLTQVKHQLALSASQLNAVSPLATLERGYSITANAKQQIIHSTEQVHIGETIISKVLSGKIISTITHIEEE